MMRSLCAAVFVLLTSAASAQTNKCTEPFPSGVVADPNTAYIESAGHTAVTASGNPLIEFYEIAYFAQGANLATAQPLQGPSTIPKTAFVTVVGTCYQVRPLTLQIPTSSPTLVAAIRGRRTANDTANGMGDWSAVSNPFGPTPPPAALKPVVGRVVLNKIP